jgi:hypothetical protein
LPCPQHRRGESTVPHELSWGRSRWSSSLSSKAQADGQRQKQQREAAHIVIEVAEATARQQQQALADSLSTPAAFIAKCGGPTHRRSGASAWDLTGTGLERSAYEALVYSKAPTSMDVIFTQDEDFPVLYREHLDHKMYRFVPYDGLVEMGCVKARPVISARAANTFRR